MQPIQSKQIKPGPAKGKRGPHSPGTTLVAPPVWLTALAAALIFLSFSPALTGEFLKWDDDWYIQENPRVTNLQAADIPDIFGSFFNGQYSPLTTIALGIQYGVAGGKPLAMHLVSILLHLINAFLVYRLISRLFNRNDLALITALLFGFHSLQVEAVAWISAQKILFYSLFFFLSLLAYLNYLQSRKLLPYLLSLLWFILSFLAKEQAVMLAVTLVAIDYFKGRTLLNRTTILEKLPFFALALLMGIVTIYSSRTGEFYTDKNPGLVSHIVFPAYALVMYGLKTIFPFHLSAFYPYPTDPELPIPLPYYLFLIPLVLFAIGLFRYLRTRPAVGFGLLFFLANLVLVLGFLPLRDFVMADRYMYIPGIGLFVILAYLLTSYSEGNLRRQANLRMGLALYLLLLAIVSFGRSRVWSDSFSLFTDMTEKYPESPVAWNNRGLAATNLQKYELAEKDFEKTIELNPRFVFAYNNLGIVFTKVGKPDKAVKALDYALKLQPGFAQALYNRGDAHAALGHFPEAISDYSAFIQEKPNHALAWSVRGITRAKGGDMQGGLADLNESIRLNPGEPDSYMNRGVVRMNLKDYQGAISDFTAALSAKPGFSYTLFNRGLAYLQLGQTQQACQDLQQASAGGFKQADALIAQYCR